VTRGVIRDAVCPRRQLFSVDHVGRLDYAKTAACCQNLALERDVNTRNTAIHLPTAHVYRQGAECVTLASDPVLPTGHGSTSSPSLPSSRNWVRCEPKGRETTGQRCLRTQLSTCRRFRIHF